MFIVPIFLWSAIFHARYVLSLDCEYTSREYQVVLREDIMIPAFRGGVSVVLDELDKIGKAEEIDFKVSLSTLKYKSVSVSEYVSAYIRDASDFNVPLRFKSRRKSTTEPADIVMKTSNADPELACWSLKIAADYTDQVSSKFELDVYAENGRILPKTAISYTIDLSPDFDQTSTINLSKYLTNAATKLTRSGLPLIIEPDHIGLVIMQIVEFDIRLLGEKFGATIFLLQRASGLQTEFSFKIKDANVNWEVLLAAQQLLAKISQIRSIAQFAA